MKKLTNRQTILVDLLARGESRSRAAYNAGYRNTQSVWKTCKSPHIMAAIELRKKALSLEPGAIAPEDKKYFQTIVVAFYPDGNNKERPVVGLRYADVVKPGTSPEVCEYRLSAILDPTYMRRAV